MSDYARWSPWQGVLWVRVPASRLFDRAVRNLLVALDGDAEKKDMAVAATDQRHRWAVWRLKVDTDQANELLDAVAALVRDVYGPDATLYDGPSDSITQPPDHEPARKESALLAYLRDCAGVKS